MVEWKHVFKGEAINLDKILSSLQCIMIDPERKAHIGDTEISIGRAETKWKVEMSSEWSTAWISASKATSFILNTESKSWPNMAIILKGCLPLNGLARTTRLSSMTKESGMRLEEAKPCYSQTTNILPPSMLPLCKTMGSSTNKPNESEEDV